MKLLVFDANNILNRSFYGVPLLSTKRGEFTNAIHGFLSSFLKIKAEINPDGLVFAFDLPKKTFRNSLDFNYKSNRKQMPEELRTQFPILRELLEAMGYVTLSCEGFEADDIIGTLADYCEKDVVKSETGNFDGEKIQCYIATGDRDCLQLISKNVFVRLLKNKTVTNFDKSLIYDEKRFIEEYKILPREFIDVKALQGDSSDNIKGVAGIGPKTAISLIQKFKSIENIYANLESGEIKSGTRLKLAHGKENAFMSKVLATIRRDVPILIDFDRFILKNVQADTPKVLEIMRRLELFTMIEKFGLNNYRESTKKDVNAVFVDENFDIDNVIEKGKISKEIFILGSSNHGANDKSGDADKGIENVIIAVSFDDETDVYVIREDNSKIGKLLKSIASITNLAVVTHDSKKIRNLFQRIVPEVSLKVGFDTALAAYLLNSSAKDYAVRKILVENSIPIPNLKNENYISKSSAVIERIKQVFMLKELKNVQIRRLREIDCVDLLYNIEQPLSQILFEMEKIGIEINAVELAEHSLVLQDKMSKLQSEIFNTVGSEFNINSPKQLSEVLYEKLKLPHAKKTKIGFSTSANILENLKYAHPVVKKILEFRTISKLKSTFCDSILKKIDRNNRIHSQFNQTETTTGRISSSEPNIQNIPIRSKEGEIFRKFFKARKGFMLVGADYSQIELRILAHISRDTNMIQAFINGNDIHQITASQIFKVPINRVTPEMRARAKTVNFGIVYGMSAFTLASQLRIFRKSAENYISSYFSHYSGVEIYMEKIVNFAKKNNYVETIFHRRRYLPEINSKVHNTRSAAERMARNMPVQGTAADIIKIAMINVDQEMKSMGLRSRIVLQVHDELLVESPDDEVDRVKEILNAKMRNVIDLLVPLEVNIGFGRTWYECKGS